MDGQADRTSTAADNRADYLPNCPYCGRRLRLWAYAHRGPTQPHYRCDCPATRHASQIVFGPPPQSSERRANTPASTALSKEERST